jgi:hypothetical protein
VDLLRVVPEARVDVDLVGVARDQVAGLREIGPRVMKVARNVISSK